MFMNKKKLIALITSLTMLASLFVAFQTTSVTAGVTYVRTELVKSNFADLPAIPEFIPASAVTGGLWFDTLAARGANQAEIDHLVNHGWTFGSQGDNFYYMLTNGIPTFFANGGGSRVTEKTFTLARNTTQFYTKFDVKLDRLAMVNSEDPRSALSFALTSANVGTGEVVAAISIHGNNGEIRVASGLGLVYGFNERNQAQGGFGAVRENGTVVNGITAGDLIGKWLTVEIYCNIAAGARTATFIFTIEGGAKAEVVIPIGRDEAILPTNFQVAPERTDAGGWCVIYQMRDISIGTYTTGTGTGTETPPPTTPTVTDPPTPEPVVTPTPAPGTFTDLDGFEWAVPAITEMAAAGLVSGRGAGIFAPADTVTRAEFTQFIYNVLKDDARFAGPGTPFADVPADAWFATSTAVFNGLGLYADLDIAAGLNPNAAISRGEMAKVIAKLAGVLGLQPTRDAVVFGDVADADKAAVETAFRTGLLSGTGEGTFSPNDTLNRAQVAALQRNLVNALK
jgi:hypothetical protein